MMKQLLQGKFNFFSMLIECYLCGIGYNLKKLSMSEVLNVERYFNLIYYLAER